MSLQISIMHKMVEHGSILCKNGIICSKPTIILEYNWCREWWFLPFEKWPLPCPFPYGTEMTGKSGWWTRKDLVCILCIRTSKAYVSWWLRKDLGCILCILISIACTEYLRIFWGKNASKCHCNLCYFLTLFYSI